MDLWHDVFQPKFLTQNIRQLEQNPLFFKELTNLGDGTLTDNLGQMLRERCLLSNVNPANSQTVQKEYDAGVKAPAVMVVNNIDVDTRLVNGALATIVDLQWLNPITGEYSTSRQGKTAMRAK